MDTPDFPPCKTKLENAMRITIHPSEADRFYGAVTAVTGVNIIPELLFEKLNPEAAGTS